jgi:hypothetical protein
MNADNRHGQGAETDASGLLNGCQKHTFREAQAKVCPPIKH